MINEEFKNYLQSYEINSKNVKAFLEKGADANEGLRNYLFYFVNNERGGYASGRTVSERTKKFPSIVKTFTKYGADPSLDDNWCLEVALSLCYVYKSEHISCIKTLLDIPKLDLLKKDFHGNSVVDRHLGHRIPKISEILLNAEKKQIQKQTNKNAFCLCSIFRNKSQLSDERRAQEIDKKYRQLNAMY